MADSIDILTKDEQHVRIFAEGIEIDERLPKYVNIMNVKHKAEKEIDLENVTPDSYRETLNKIVKISDNKKEDRLKYINHDILRKYLIESINENGNDGFSITDFNVTLSERMREIVKDTAFYKNGIVYGTSSIKNVNGYPEPMFKRIKWYHMLWDVLKTKKKQLDDKNKSNKFDVVRYFSDIRFKSEENAKKYVDRITEYINSIGIAEQTGQTALKERLFTELIINKYESILYANGYDKLITEEEMVELTKNAPKALSMAYIENYTRIIPNEVIEKKVELDKCEIFDNYVILHYDIDGKSYARTVAERNREVERARDPILFGVISGSNKLYYIADWQDEYCDLKFEDVVSIIGKETMEQNYLSNKINN